MNFSKGEYAVKNLQKYVGSSPPRYRSSWELSVMRMCDDNPSITEWSSEPLKIPYRDPLTSKQTIYIPDFLVIYLDRNLKKHVELWEIKPENQTIKEHVGKNPYNQSQFIKNQAKWAAASIWCKQHNIHFRILTEHDIFSNTKK